MEHQRADSQYSYRRHRDLWCEAVVLQIEEQFPWCEKVDVACYYSSPHGDTALDMTNSEHQRNRQQYPKTLRLRTCAEHQGRLMLLRNMDVQHNMANGSTLPQEQLVRRRLRESMWEARR